MDDVNQKKKMILLGIVLVGILTVIVLIILAVLSAAEAKKTKVVIGNKTYKTKVTQMQEGNGGPVYTLTSIIDPQTKATQPFMVTTPNNELYFNLKVVAETFCDGYVYNKGLYGGIPDESEEKCHIISKGEIVSFSSQSNEITKYFKDTDKYEKELAYKEINKKEKIGEDIEIFTVEGTPVIKFADGQLYASLEAIQKGLNMVIARNGVIFTVYPLETLIASYSPLLSKEGYTLTTNFKNQRALYEKLAVCEQSGAYCVVRFENDNSLKKVISTQYESIEYVQSMGNFIVSIKNRQTDELQFGMNSPEGNQIIPAEYESLKLLDAENNLYLTKLNGMYGVVKSENDRSEEIIKTEYSGIGLDSVIEYANQDFTNPYIIDNYTIITKRNGKFGLYSIEKDELIKPNRMQQFGCPNPSAIIKEETGRDITAYPTIIVPYSDDINLLVFEMDGKFGLLDPRTGGIIVNNNYKAIYSTSDAGKRTYRFHKVRDGKDEIFTFDEIKRQYNIDALINNKRSHSAQSHSSTSDDDEDEEEEEEEEQEEQEQEEEPEEEPEEDYSRGDDSSDNNDDEDEGDDED